jgi:hypothetical protein
VEGALRHLQSSLRSIYSVWHVLVQCSMNLSFGQK